MTSPAPPAVPTRDPYALPLLTALLAGCAVATALGVYASLHDPTGIGLDIAGFSGAGYAKAWLTTVAAVLAVVQLGSGIRLYRPAAPAWAAPVHRWSGRIAVVITVPVVVHCIYALGFQTSPVRVLLHSMLGCFFYGAFVAKMLVLTRRGLPGWVLPVLGGCVFAGLIGLWLTSAVWLFTSKGLHF